MLSKKEQQLLDALAPRAEQEGVEIVTVEVAGAKKAPTIRVYIDTPDGVSFDELSSAQAWINDLMDERGHLLAGLVERLTVLEIALLVEMHDLDLLGFLHLSLLSGVVSTSPMPTGIKTRLHSVTLGRFGLKRID